MAALVAAAMPFISCTKDFDTSTVEDFDLSRYLGEWYEIARYDHSFEEGMDNQEILKIAMEGIEYDLFDEIDVDYLCTCSEERMKQALVSIGQKDLEKLFAEQVAEGKPEELEIVCRFCNSRYTFKPSDLY